MIISGIAVGKIEIILDNTGWYGKATLFSKFIVKVGENAVWLDNGEELMMSRRKKKKVLEQFAKDVYEGLKATLFPDNAPARLRKAGKNARFRYLD